MFFWIASLLISSIYAHNPHESIYGMDASSDGRTILALLERDVIVRSTDGGESWQNPKKPGVFQTSFEREDVAIGLDPHSNEALWIHTGKVVKSNDKGRTWNVIGNIPSRSGTKNLSNRFGNKLKYVGGTVLARIGSDLLRSTNRGHTWEFVHSVKDCISVLHVERSSNTVFVGACDGSVFVSKNAGSSWVSLLGSSATHNDAVTSFSKGFPEHCDSNSFPLLIGTESGRLLVSCLDLSSLSMKNNHHLRTVHEPYTDEKKGSHTAALISQPAPGLLMLATGMKAQTLHRNDYNPLHPKSGWQEVRTSDGLYSSTGRPTEEVSYNFVVPCPGHSGKGDRFLVGGYWGIFRSDYIAKQSEFHVPNWVKLDTLTTVVTSISISRAIGSVNGNKHLARELGSNNGNNPLVVVSCTYATNCFFTEIDTKNHSVGKRSVLSMPECVRYGVPALSPSFAHDGLMFISCDRVLYKVKLAKESQNYVVKSKTEVNIPLIDHKGKGRIHSIVFSPNFGDSNHHEGKTVFVTGNNIGVVRSTNGGKSFKRVWDTHGADGLDGLVTIALSPNYVSDGTIAVSFRGWNTPGRDLGKLPHGCTNKDALDWTSDNCNYSNQYGKGNAIALSHDYGNNYKMVSDVNYWRMYPMLVQANDDKNVVRLVVVKGNDNGVPMILEGNAASKSLNSFNWKPLSGLPNGFNPADSAVSAGNGHLILGSTNGDIVFGEINAKRDKIGNMKHSPWTEFFDGKHGAIPASSRRGRTPMIAFSPYYDKDGYIFGGSMSSVKMSRDGGSSWNKLTTIGHVTEACGNLKNCAKCRMQALEVTYPILTDLGGLCITCKEGFKKNVLARHAPEEARYNALVGGCIRENQGSLRIRNKQ